MLLSITIFIVCVASAQAADTVLGQYCLRASEGSLVIDDRSSIMQPTFVHDGKPFTGVVCTISDYEGGTLYLIPYRDGVIDGVLQETNIEFYSGDAGRIWGVTTPYKNGLKHGIETYSSSDESYGFNTYVNGTLDGVATHIYQRNAGGTITRYKNGKVDGSSIRLFARVFHEYFYDNGLLRRYKKYYNLCSPGFMDFVSPADANKCKGELLEEYDFIKGFAQGYYLDGTLLWKGDYRDQKLQGVVKFYYEDGALQAEIPYHNGKKDGEAKYYLKDGNLFSQAIYKDGLLIDGTISEYSLHEGDTYDLKIVHVVTSYKNGEQVGSFDDYEYYEYEEDKNGQWIRKVIHVQQ